MTRKKKWLVSGVLISLLLVFILAYAFMTRSTSKLNKRDFIQSTRPTLFFHGFGSSARAEQHMTNAAREAGVTKTIIRANVDRDGRVTLIGSIPKGAINPIVEVNYEDNRNSDYPKDAAYAKAVVSKLQETYHFKEMNMVGHSMGNMSILYYLLEHSQDEGLPQLQKQVNIANHVNGLEGMDLPEGLTVDEETGQPNKMNQNYQTLLGLREIYPQNQVDILNIYGDLKNQSDGSVLNSSSRSLKYLVVDNAKTYQEKKFTGAKAQHSQLHENPAVDKVLIDFLWAK